MAKHDTLIKTIVGIAVACTLTMSVAGGFLTGFAMKDFNGGAQNGNGNGNGDAVRSITSIEKTNTYGLIDEYTIYYSDCTTSTFIVANGANGEQGIQGFPGENGQTPTIEIGANGHWIINGEDTGITAQGVQGPAGQDGRSIYSIEKTNSYGLIDEYTIYYSDGTTSIFLVTNGADGEQGIQGFPGPAGHTPVIEIGTNGNWYIDGTDSGVSALGQNGQDGRSIVSVAKTDTNGLVDTYTITYSDNTTSTFTITNGANGTNGTNGTNGQNGENGVTPHIGENGHWWIGEQDTGVAAQGQAGENGQNGQNGENGITPHIGGNGNWWIGETDTGVAAQGQNGQNGQNGENGVTPHIGANGNWWIGETDTGVAAQGEQGAAGQNGQNGENGVTPHIGTNGNWYIGETDTGIAAQGEQGQAGQNGADGKTLLTGTSAPANDEGSVGDSYIDVSTWTLYVKTAEDSWTSKGTFKGADGDNVTISNISTSGTGAPGTSDTYTITFSDGNTLAITVYNGANGTNGINGTNGNSLLTGTINPTTEGVNGDSYLNTQTWEYYVKENDAWVSKGSIQGPSGADGNKIYVGNTAPSSTSGYQLGDLYINSDTGMIYVLEQVGENPISWSGKGSIMGPQGINGKSAYELAKDHGYTGTEAEWLLSLVGADGLSAYELAQGNGYTGSLSEWLDSLVGANGKSAYQIYCDNNADPDLSEADWLASLAGENGKSAYELYCDSHADPDLSQAEWLASLVGQDGQNGQDGTSLTVGDSSGLAPASTDGYQAGDSFLDTSSWNLWVVSDDGMGGLTWGSSPVGNLQAAATTHSVMFDLGDANATIATPIDLDDVTHGDTISYPLEDPELDGYLFQGWYTQEGNKWNFEKDVVSYDITLVAHWATFRVENGVLTGCSGAGDIEIPMFFDGQMVTEIGDNAFKDNTAVTSVAVHNAITSIGNSAFEGCTGLESIVVPSSVKTIGDNAFDGCTNLAYAYMETNTTRTRASGGLTSIGDYAFRNCPLRAVVVPDSVEHIGFGAFANEYSSWEIDGSLFNDYTGDFYNGLLYGSFDEMDSYADSAYYYYAYLCTDIDHFGEVYYCTEDYYDYDLDEYVYCFDFDTTLPMNEMAFGDGVPTAQSGSYYLDLSTYDDGYYIYAYTSSSPLESISVPFLGDGDTNNFIGYIFGATSASANSAFVPQYLEYVTITGNKTITSDALAGCQNIYSLYITGCPEMIEDGAFKDCTNLSILAIPYVGRWAVEPAGQSSGTIAPDYSYGDSDPDNSTGGYIYCNYFSGDIWANNGGGWAVLFNAYDQNTRLGAGSPSNSLSGYEYYFNYENSDLYEYNTSLHLWLYSMNFAEYYLANAGIGGGGSSGSNEIFFGSIFGASDYYEQKDFIPQSLYEVIILGGNGDNYDTIPENAFQGSGSYNQLQFDTLVISGNVKTIKANAFQYCSFDSVTIEETVVSIESNAFYYCVFDYLTIPFLGHDKMDSSTLFSGVYGLDVDNIILTSGNGYDGDQIYNDGFKYLNKTYSITLPENITYIGTNAFYNCLNLTSITLPSGIEAINDYAFYSCTSLTSIVIPDRVTQIGERAFYLCSNLKDVYLPNGLLTIGNSAFGYCSNIKGISLPNSLKTIDEFAFFNTDLTYVVIPENVTEIKESAFLRCESLSSVLIKEGATKKIEDEAFSHCSSLKKVVIEGRVSTLSSSAFYDCDNLEYISLPSNLTTLQYEMFRGYTKLETVILPNSLITVGERAFWGCTSLKSITLPNGVTTIGQYAFYECKNLNYIYFSDSLTTINNHAFERCNSLKSLVIPNSVTTIGSDVFKPDPAWKYLFNLKTYYGNSNSTIYSGTYANLASNSTGNNGDIYVVSSGTDHKYEIYVREGTGSNWVKVEPYIKGVTIINAVGTELPDAIASINHLFINSNTGDVYVSCSSQLESITLPLSSVTSYFSTLPYTLKTIVINNATSIGNNAFSNDYNLETIVINGTPTTIGQYAFNNCYSLTNLSLPNTITKIDNYAFTGCRSLSGFVVPQRVESIGYQSFNGCTSLKYVYFNENLKFIVRQAFMNCTALESIALPDSIESLGIGAFDGCSSLKTLSLAKAGLRQKLGNILYDNTLHEQGKPSDSLGNNNDIFLHTNPNASTASGVTAGSVYRKIAGTWYREYLIWDDPNYADTLRAGSGAPTSSSGTSGVYVNVDNGDYYKYSGGSYTWIYAGNIDDLYSKVGLLFYHLDLSSGNNSTPKIVYECDLDTYNASVPSSLKVLSLTGSNETTLGSNLQGCANLEVVELASTMTAISDYAFDGCTSLKEISNPGNIQVIGNYAFQGTSYQEISGFDSLQTVGSYAFYQSTTLKSAEFPSALTTIGAHAFEGNVNLRSVDFSRDAYDSPATVDIGESGFNGCISLQEVINSKAIKSIGDAGFIYCGELKTINLNYCTSVGATAFQNCSMLTSVVMPTSSSYTRVSSSTFKNCYSLASITLSSYVTTIGDSAFKDCRSLLMIDIRNVTLIEESAFENCFGLMYIHIKINNLIVEQNAFNECNAIVQIHIWDINNGSYYNTWKTDATKVNQTGNRPLTTANDGGGPSTVTHG